MNNNEKTKTELNSLLTPDNCVLIPIDHRTFQVSGIQNTDPAKMINSVVALGGV